MMPLPDRLEPGSPVALGANWDGLGVNFAVFSANADRIELCLFERTGRREIARLDLPECTDEVFHGYLPDARPGLLYGYRAHGPYQPEQGHRFNPNKLLLDPYARLLSGTLHWSDSLYGYRVGAARGDLSFDRRDSAAALPKSVVTDGIPADAGHAPPRRGWSETIIYEAHIRGLTRQRSDIDPIRRGTFAALADPRMIDHLLKLGITAVELLPVQAFAQDWFLVEKGLGNYWGYSTLSYFSPEPRYVIEPDAAIDEVRAAIRRLHAAGIEVILDVVYNHTCEGDERGPTLCWRGLDNASYYRLLPERERYYINDTGCGNTLNIAHSRVLQMVMDSLRYWVEAYQVDGFRFDLGPVLGREAAGFDPGAGFFDAVRQDPVLAKVKLISEPWDIGPGGYQLGNHPPGFAEWNDKFRDSARRFWRGDAGERPELARRLMGSSELFDRRRRRPWASVNYAASHDGFTLRDVVSYNQRHNFANGEENRDGHGDNCSSNWGSEGETDSPAILARRHRIIRALLATVFVSHGTPMLLAGDELGRTQRGNNNAYCQDNEVSWLDWAPLLAGDAGEERRLPPFIARLARLRRDHPSLASPRFLHGTDEVLPGITDVDWFDETGEPLTPEGWRDPSAHRLALRRAVVQDGAADITLALLNASPHDCEFTLPEPKLGWRMEINTAKPTDLPHMITKAPVVPAHSLVLLSASTDGVLPMTAQDADMAGSFAFETSFGAVTRGARTRFALWAPGQEAVYLEIEGQDSLPMRRGEDGLFTIEAECGAGTRYKYRVNDLAVPDPVSRLQPEDVHGPSEVVDPRAFSWKNPEWRGRPWEEAVILEVHPGAAGGFAGLARDLPRIAALGVTVVELMPIADFPGRHNWGYDGVLPYAPDSAYGTPEELKTLIDTAHGIGLMVFLDVVYNHFGPDGNYLNAYAPGFFREDIHTLWGAAIDFRKPQVRTFFIENALYWLMEYRFDGLRFDAVHAIEDNAFLMDMAKAIRNGVEPGRHVHLVLENDDNVATLLRATPEAPGYDAQWADDTHHCFHVLLTGTQEGYYEDYPRAAAQLARCLGEGFAYQGEPSEHRGGETRGEPSTHLPPTDFVIFLQNHDQIGNRALGDRLTTLANTDALRAATLVLLLTPQIPLLFMGQEWGEDRPFLYFTDHQDPELAEAVRNGRRKEFEKFEAFASPEMRARIPDPNDPGSFEESVPHLADPPQGEQASWLDLHETLLRIRREAIIPRLRGARSLHAEALGEHGILAAWRMADGATLTIAANFGTAPVPCKPAAGDILASVPNGMTVDDTLLPHAAIAWLEPK